MFVCYLTYIQTVLSKDEDFSKAKQQSLNSLDTDFSKQYTEKLLQCRYDGKGLSYLPTLKCREKKRGKFSYCKGRKQCLYLSVCIFQ